MYNTVTWTVYLSITLHVYTDSKVDIHLHIANCWLACMQLASCGQCCLRDLLKFTDGGWTMRGASDPWLKPLEGVPLWIDSMVWRPECIRTQRTQNKFVIVHHYDIVCLSVYLGVRISAVQIPSHYPAPVASLSAWSFPLTALSFTVSRACISSLSVHMEAWVHQTTENIK